MTAQFASRGCRSHQCPELHHHDQHQKRSERKDSPGSIFGALLEDEYNITSGAARGEGRAPNERTDTFRIFFVSLVNFST
jgi:hypothetical protein